MLSTAPEWLQGALGALSTVVIAWMGYKGVTRKAKAEQQVTTEETVRKQVESLMQQQARRIDDLAKRVDHLEGERSQLLAENRQIRAELHAAQSALEAAVTFASIMEAWVAEGASPPPPEWPVAFRLHMEAMQKAAEAEQ